EGHIFLLDALGNPVAVEPSEVPSEYLPPGGVKMQVPPGRRGAKVPPWRQERLRGGAPKGIQWFSQNQPGLASYLSSLDELGNTALQPGPFLPYEQITHRVQRAKYTLSDFGFSYTFQQGVWYVASLNNAVSDSQSLGYYAFELYAKQL